MLATRWYLLLSKLTLSLSSPGHDPHLAMRLIDRRLPAYASSAAMSAARRAHQLRMHAQLRRSGHRG